MVIEECKKRRLKQDISNKEKFSDDTSFCMNPIEEKKSIKKIEEEEKKEENEDKALLEETKKGFMNQQFSNLKNIGKNLGKLSNNTYTKLKSAKRKVEKLINAEEKIQETLVLLSGLNGLFIIMKAQYDEVMKYYEKHLDVLIGRYNSLTDSTYIPNNIFIKDRELASKENPTLYEKASYIVEFSNEYISFMVPPKLQSVVDETINILKSDIVQKKLEEEIDDTLKLQKVETQEDRNNAITEITLNES